MNRLSKKEEELREKVHQQTESHLTKIASVENRLRELETENLELREKFESVSFVFPKSNMGRHLYLPLGDKNSSFDILIN